MTIPLKGADLNKLLQETGKAGVLHALDQAEIFTAGEINGASSAPQESFTFPIPTPFKWIDPRQIPPRGFVYGPTSSGNTSPVPSRPPRPARPRS